MGNASRNFNRARPNVKLIFDAVTAVGQGTYCNEAKVITGNLKTRSGQRRSWRLMKPLDFALAKPWW